MKTRSRRTALAAAALGLFAVAEAGAADLGPYRPRSGPPAEISTWAPSRIERWTGFYMGATYGYSWGSAGVEGTTGTFTFDQNGSMGTLFGGYNWQAGNTVFGVEADIGTGSHDGSAVIGNSTVRADINAMGSIRGRAGFLATPALLLYATGGFAWADMDFKLNNVRASDTFTGYQLGAGAEMMFAPQWLLRVEYLYTDYGKEQLTNWPARNAFDPDAHTVRAGVAFKF